VKFTVDAPLMLLASASLASNSANAFFVLPGRTGQWENRKVEEAFSRISNTQCAS
jgi:hypothetical protein